MINNTMDLMELVRKAESADADTDFLREALRTLAQALMEADVTAQIGAALGERAPEQRTTRRNGYRTLRWDTRMGTVELEIRSCGRDLLPALAVGAATSGGEGAGQRGDAGLRRGGLDPTGR